MRQQDYSATHLVKAVKGSELNPKAYAYATIGGRRTKITNTNKDQAINWFAEWASPQIDALGAGPKVLVPVPSSMTVVGAMDEFRTALIARVMASYCANATVAPVLRWTEEMVPSYAGGPRNKWILYPKLALTGPVPQGTLVLIDDVQTTGGHLIASAWRLEDQNRSVPLAVCCGRTFHEQQDDPFTMADENLDLSRFGG